MKKYIILLFLLILFSCEFNEEQENDSDTDSIILFNSEEEENGINLFGDSNILAGNCTEGDCYSGQGTFLANDSTIYSGSFKDGMAHGQGKLIIFDGQYWEGNWILGKLVTGIQHDIYENTIYQGDFSSINTKIRLKAL